MMIFARAHTPCVVTTENFSTRKRAADDVVINDRYARRTTGDRIYDSGRVVISTSRSRTSIAQRNGDLGACSVEKTISFDIPAVVPEDLRPLFCGARATSHGSATRSVAFANDGVME